MIKHNSKPQFDDARNFSEGLASVEIGDKWGFINKAGVMVIKPQFETPGILFFSEGLACVEVGDKDRFIDKTGKIVI